MTGRYITLGDGCRVTLGRYVRIWRAALVAHDGARFSRSLCDRWETSRRELLAQFRAGLDDRINRHMPGYGAGRKWSPDWQRAAAYTARLVNTPRLAVRWVPPEFRTRLARRVTSAR